MKTTKKFATVYSKNGYRTETLGTNGCQLFFDPKIYDFMEHDIVDEGLKEVQKKPEFSWIQEAKESLDSTESSGVEGDQFSFRKPQLT